MSETTETLKETNKMEIPISESEVEVVKRKSDDEGQQALKKLKVQDVSDDMVERQFKQLEAFFSPMVYVPEIPRQPLGTDYALRAGMVNYKRFKKQPVAGFGKKFNAVTLTAVYCGGGGNKVLGPTHNVKPKTTSKRSAADAEEEIIQEPEVEIVDEIAPPNRKSKKSNNDFDF